MKRSDVQPKEEDFNCPHCGSRSGDFYVYTDLDLDGESDLDRDYIVDNDLVVCDNCNNEWIWENIKHMFSGKIEKCPHCDGSGWIRKE